MLHQARQASQNPFASTTASHVCPFSYIAVPACPVCERMQIAKTVHLAAVLFPAVLDAVLDPAVLRPAVLNAVLAAALDTAVLVPGMLAAVLCCRLFHFLPLRWLL